MSRHDDSVSLREMLDHAREAVQFIRGASRHDVESNRLLSLALVRLCEIIGEAGRRVSKAKQQQHPEVHWAQIIAFRNRLSHGYNAIDYDGLWDILSNDVPAHVTALEKIVPP